jgi:20S proteasome subunit alpha 2
VSLCHARKSHAVSIFALPRCKFSMKTRRLSLSIASTWWIIIFTHQTYHSCFANQYTDPIEGRYSFSLTTFHPLGSLPQLNAAITAASLGPPIMGYSLKDGSGVILASCIQEGPSPLVREDGTERFVQITSSIAMGHTGINADGRVLCAAAQRLAIEHEYTFDEEISIDVFLEEMGLLLQRYTMKPGSRPFGCSLMVSYLSPPWKSERPAGNAARGKVFTIDPSGAVLRWEDGIALQGNDENGSFLQELSHLDKRITKESTDEILQAFVSSVSRVLESQNQSRVVSGETYGRRKLFCTYFSRPSGLTVWTI